MDVKEQTEGPPYPGGFEAVMARALDLVAGFPVGLGDDTVGTTALVRARLAEGLPEASKAMTAARMVSASSSMERRFFEGWLGVGGSGVRVVTVRDEEATTVGAERDKSENLKINGARDEPGEPKTLRGRGALGASASFGMGSLTEGSATRERRDLVIVMPSTGGNQKPSGTTAG